MKSKNLDVVRERLASELKRIGPEHVSERIGVALATVYNWMKGANTPLNRLMQLEEVGADVLYVLTGQRSQPTSAADTLTPRQQALLANYQATDEEGRRHIEYAAFLAAESSAPSKSRRKVV